MTWGQVLQEGWATDVVLAGEAASMSPTMAWTVPVVSMTTMARR